jgi:hypothetical protein
MFILRFLPTPSRDRLNDIDTPDEPAPSLHPHPSEQELHRYYEPVRQRTPHRYSTPPVCYFGALPLATTKQPSRHIDARLLPFRTRAADQDHAIYTPGTAWPGTRAPAKLITGTNGRSPLSMPSKTYDATTMTPTNGGRFWNVFLVPT